MRGRAITGDQVKQFVKGSYEDKKGTTKNIDGYELDESLSSRKAKVYHNPQTGKAVVANRGTKGTIADWTNNLAYLTGTYKYTDRYKHAKQTQKEANRKYGADNVINVGHSQSGATIRHLNDAGLVNKAIVVNPASKHEAIRKNEEVIRSNRDLVSMLTPDSKRVHTIKADTYNPLTEHSGEIIRGKHARRSYGGRLNMVGTNSNTYTPRHL
jgi:hypothetical protein